MKFRKVVALISTLMVFIGMPGVYTKIIQDEAPSSIQKNTLHCAGRKQNYLCVEVASLPGAFSIPVQVYTVKGKKIRNTNFASAQNNSVTRGFLKKALLSPE